MTNSNNNKPWSINYTYTYTPESYQYFYNQPTRAERRHLVEQEMQLLRDIDLWVDIMGDDLPDAKAILKKIMDK